ncbi:high mobility group B protein 13 [Carex littledalei]|uniref:High mobility group B protein 13 n=1 Tax=Carex littledalei TaxID=544730 RepID=A0A833VSD1_9POAL|nr:high mobility group B protein 13 [Carex littledalei]
MPNQRKKLKTTTETSSPAFTDELEKLQAQLQQLQIEKSKTDEMLKEKDEILKKKEEQQEKLQAELKKLQRVKEFKPTVNFPLVKSLIEKEQEEKDKKKKNKSSKSTLKKPCPAYALWLKDQWTEMKKENPEAEFKEISNTLGAKWKGLSGEEKKPYEEKYQQDKEAYLQVVGKEKRETEAMKLLEEEHMQKTAMELLEQYLKFKQEADDLGKKKSRKEKDPLKPKQPMSAFIIFSNERRSTLAENRSVVEVAKIAGEEWKGMSDKQKTPYEEIARKHKEDYKQQMEVYNQKKLEETTALEKEEEEQKKVLKQEALQLLKKKEKTENIIKKTKENQKKQKDENADPNKPKKPASSFILFSKEARKQLQEERPGTANSTVNALISVKWKELSEEEKQKWTEKAAKDMVEYKKEMEEYNKSKPSSSN